MHKFKVKSFIWSFSLNGKLGLYKKNIQPGLLNEERQKKERKLKYMKKTKEKNNLIDSYGYKNDYNSLILQ